MRVSLTILVWVSVSCALHGQNLVFNPGFEAGDSANCKGNLPSAYGWDHLNDGPICANVNFASPDYFKDIGVGFMTIPDVFAGTIVPRSGTACAGMICYHGENSDWREYLGTALQLSLEVGKHYELNIYVTNGSSPSYGWGTDRISAYLSVDKPHQDGTRHLPVTPQLIYSNVFFDTSWVKLTFNFLSDSAYQFLTIGNFDLNADLNYQQFVPTFNILAYYFVDDISLYKSLQFQADTVICKGDSLLLVQEGGLSTNYWWRDNATGDTLGNNQAIYIKPVTDQTIVLEGDSGESFTRTIHVVDYPAVSLPGDTATCLDQLFIDAVTNAISHSWSDGNTTAAITVNATGTYVLEGSNGYCSTFDSIEVAFNGVSIDLGSDTTICFGHGLALTSREPGTHRWSTGETGNEIFVSEAGRYWLEIDNKGCMAADTIVISKDYGGRDLYVPKIFTPNGDGHNDFFEVFEDGYLTNVKLVVYNRWGALVYEQSETYGQWDGRSFSETELPEGVYFWVYRYLSDCDEGELKGTVQLVR